MNINWKDVNKEKPKNNDYCLIFTKRNFWDIAEFKNGEFINWAIDLSKPVGIMDDVTHWCKLEKPRIK